MPYHTPTHNPGQRRFRVSLFAIPAILTVACGFSAWADPKPERELITVTGTVREAAGGPVAGAIVQPRAGTTERPPRATTDSLGRYTLTTFAARGDTLTIYVWSTDHDTETAQVLVDADRLVLDVVMGGSNPFLEMQAVRDLTPLTVSGATPSPAPRALQGKVGDARQTAGYFDPRPRPPFNTEEYSYIDENSFMAARSDPLSTFSIDVDRASYANVRRFLVAQSQLPPRDAVRIEELVNYFPYSYAEPRGEHPVAISTEVARAPWNREHLLVRVGLQTERLDLADLPPNNLVFLIDVSGSMYAANKLPLVKQSLRMLVDELRPEDRIAIVTYAGNARVALPPTSMDEKERILGTIERLEAGGSTAGGAGIRMAYALARDSYVEGGNNRVILASDGDFNIGVSSTSELVKLVEDQREHGTYLTILGFGMGNLKDSRMEQMAAHGNGNYAYIDNLLEARKVLVNELGGTLSTVANDVKLQIEFNPRVARAYRLIGYENRLMDAADFDNDAKDAGELGAGHSVTALYEVIPVGARSSAEVKEGPELRYQEERISTAAAGSDELMAVALRYKRPGESASRLMRHVVRNRVAAPSEDFRFATAVAGFGMLLRESKHVAGWNYAAAREMARGALGEDVEGYRAGFVEMVRAAEMLSRVAVER